MNTLPISLCHVLTNAARYRLNSKCLHAMAVLSDDESMSMIELANALSVSSGGMTAIADSLERAGFIDRTANPLDRRTIFLKLTIQGQNALNEILKTA